MNKQTLLDYIRAGHEIEFKWNDNMYSITQGIINGQQVISFCQFYKESTEVHSPEELLKIKRYNTTVLEMIQSISEKDMWIY